MFLVTSPQKYWTCCCWELLFAAGFDNTVFSCLLALLETFLQSLWELSQLWLPGMGSPRKLIQWPVWAPGWYKWQCRQYSQGLLCCDPTFYWHSCFSYFLQELEPAGVSSVTANLLFTCSSFLDRVCSSCFLVFSLWAFSHTHAMFLSVCCESRSVPSAFLLVVFCSP